MPLSSSSVPDQGSFNILMASPEAAPFAKTGGLADVAGSLPRELARLGHQVRLVMPGYGFIDRAAFGFKEWKRLSIPTFSGPVQAVIERTQLADPAVPPERQVWVYLIRYDPYFDRPGLYQQAGVDYPDNLERFVFFCRATLELLLALRQFANWVPHLFHAHDWQAALCPVYLRTLYAADPRLARIATLFTVHNLGYQGIFPGSEFWKTGLPADLFVPSGLEFYGSLNLMKGGLIFADLLNTVSPTYSREIQTPEFGFGLDGVIASRRDRMVGVVNGIDVEVWNPETDANLPARYSAEDLSGKSLCKTALQQEMNLPRRNVPLVAIVSRLSAQKGLDLVAEILPELMSLNLQFVLLGTGDPASEDLFRSLHARFSKKIGVRIGFDEGLAHRIEGGADLFVMPSRYEPCGLNQLYSLRYGTVPVVRRTGGLADTVVPYSPLAVKEKRATGFRFIEPEAEALMATLLLALRVYKDRKEWRELMLTGMRADVSWARSARSYSDLYRQAIELRASKTGSPEAWLSLPRANP